MAGTPISTLANQVCNRVEENVPANGGPIFWSLEYEFYTALVESMNEMLLLVGRPVIQASVPITLTANTVWQAMPVGCLAILDMYSTRPLWKASLRDMDYLQSSWTAGWENDRAQFPVRWGPVGVNMFFVHPGPTTSITVTINYVQYPVQQNFPYDGTQTVPFHDEYFEAFEMYAAHYARIKETGQDFNDSKLLYQSFMALATRMAGVENRRDPLIFTQSWGIPLGIRRSTAR